MSKEVEEKQKILDDFLAQLLSFFEGELEAETENDGKDITVLVKGDDTSALTENDGKALEALRIISSSIINDRTSEYTRVSVDAGGFREKKNKRIVALAQEMADRVKAEGESLPLPDMNAYDRRIAHVALQDDPLIRTESEGEEPHRHLVLYPA